MRRLFPAPAPRVEPADAYGRLLPAGPNRAAVRLNMIESVDGAAAVNGRTAGLGGTADHAVSALLRSLADVILVGAATVRIEGYGPVPVVLDETATARRAALGLEGAPTIAVLTRSCRLDWQSSLFTQTGQRPLVLTTTSADADDRARAAAVADVIVAGDTAVDLTGAMHHLANRGVRDVLAEGGPRVSAQLAAAGLLDELCLTLAPSSWPEPPPESSTVLNSTSPPPSNSATSWSLAATCSGATTGLRRRHSPKTSDPARLPCRGQAPQPPS